MTREQLETDARARIFWGESAPDVVVLLCNNGFSRDAAMQLVQEFQQERARSIRSTAIRKMILGGTMLSVPFLTYFIFNRIGVVPLKVFGITVAVGAFGGWKLVNGLIELMLPAVEKGDLANPSN